MDQMTIDLGRGTARAGSREREGAGLAYWAIGAAVLAYVALCAPHRDNYWGADAWEHHRAIVALNHNFWNPGNPTYATDEPSIRYSPYSIALALLCRSTGVDAYQALSIAAVLNTALLIVAMHLLLRAYGMEASSPYVLVVMVSFYGVAPGYANSYALADLPWHQVNPSALSFALAPLMWVLFRTTAEAPRAWGAMVLIAVFGAVATLAHGHTGVFAFIGLAAITVSVPGEYRLRLMRRFMLVSAASFVLCVLWPWFNFLEAVLSTRDRMYWFNPFVARIMLTSWSAPALFCVPLLLILRRHELARFCLVGALICYGLAVLSFPLKSSLLARIPMPAMLLLHIPIGLYIYHNRLFSLEKWRRMLRSVWSLERQVAAPACIDVCLMLLLAYCLVPQLTSISREPGLARSYLAPVLGKQDKQLRLNEKYEQLLQPVNEHDVVLSDIVTSWPVPSFNGRVVAALHYETFTPDQPQRQRDLEAFFAANDLPTRREILARYNVKWIILNSGQMSPLQVRELLEPQAIVRQVDYLTLMDAQKWLSARQQAEAAQELAGLQTDMCPPERRGLAPPIFTP